MLTDEQTDAHPDRRTAAPAHLPAPERYAPGDAAAAVRPPAAPAADLPEEVVAALAVLGLDADARADAVERAYWEQLERARTASAPGAGYRARVAALNAARSHVHAYLGSRGPAEASPAADPEAARARSRRFSGAAAEVALWAVATGVLVALLRGLGWPWADVLIAGLAVAAAVSTLSALLEARDRGAAAGGADEQRPAADPLLPCAVERVEHRAGLRPGLRRRLRRVARAARSRRASRWLAAALALLLLLVGGGRLGLGAAAPPPATGRAATPAPSTLPVAGAPASIESLLEPPVLPAPSPLALAAVASLVNRAWLPCRLAPDPAAPIAVTYPPGTVRAVDMTLRERGGAVWYRESARGCWSQEPPVASPRFARAEEAEAAAAALRPALPGVPVRLAAAGWTVTLTEVWRTATAGRPGRALSAAGVYVVVELTVENTGPMARAPRGGDFRLVDSQGNRYDWQPQATAALGRLRLGSSVEPGRSGAVRVVFDLPADARELLLTGPGGLTVLLPDVALLSWR